MNILYNLYKQYNFMDATIVQGMRSLGHHVFSVNEVASNYAEPYNGEDYSLYFHSGRLPFSPNQASIPSDLKDVPRILVWGHDSGITKEHQWFPDILGWDACFIRDLRENCGSNVFPIHYGIEDRYYCETKELRKPLRDRSIDIFFRGQLYKHRAQILAEIQKEFGNTYILSINDRSLDDTDDLWTPQMKDGRGIHQISYYQQMADSKIVLSLLGLGPDCARHWEALASGAVPLIQFMPIIYVKPWLKNTQEYFYFTGIDDCLYIISELLENLDLAQSVANAGFESGMQNHTTASRAEYILGCLGVK